MFPLRPCSTLLGIALCSILSSCSSEKKETATKVQAEDPEPPSEVYLLDDRGADRPVGWTSVKVFSLTGSKHPATVKVADRTLEGIFSMGESRRETLQSLGADRRRLTVQRDNNSFTSEINGTPPQSGTKKGPLVGKYIIMERRDGVWTGSFESGDEPSTEEKEAIERQVKAMNEGDQMYAKPDRRVGDEWQFDAASEFGEDAKGIVRVRFDRLEEHRGEKCAVLTGSIEVDLPAPQEGAESGQVKMKGTFTTYRSLQHFVDLDTELTGTMDTTVSPQLGVTFVSSGPLRVVERSEVTIPAPVVSQR